METPEKKHSPIGASSFYRWSVCPGSVKLCETVPNIPSSYAEEGTLAHELAERLLNLNLLGIKANHHGPVPTEMVDPVTRYVEYCCDLAKGKQFWIEQAFDLGEKVYPNLYGTCDFVAFDAKEKHLTVVDYKHGAGVFVDAENNEQLLYYAVGAWMMLEQPINTVTLAVVQPRCRTTDSVIRTWTTGGKHLEFFREKMIKAAKATEDKNAPLVEGAHCRFCPALAVCPEKQKSAMSFAHDEFGPILVTDTIPVPNENVMSDPKKMSIEKLGDVLTRLTEIEAWAKSVREYAYRQAMNGIQIPGHKLVEKRASRKWKDEKAAIHWLRMLGLRDDEIFEAPEIKSAPSFDKVFRSKADREALDHLVVKESTGLTLVSNDDNRKEVAAPLLQSLGKIESA